MCFSNSNPRPVGGQPPGEAEGALTSSSRTATRGNGDGYETPCVGGAAGGAEGGAEGGADGGSDGGAEGGAGGGAGAALGGAEDGVAGDDDGKEGGAAGGGGGGVLWLDSDGGISLGGAGAPKGSIG